MSGTYDDSPSAAVEAFRRGDEWGVEALYTQFAGPVLAVAIRVLGDRNLAADCVQETFLRAWRSAASFDPAHDPAPWLFTIARRVAIDMWRARRRTVVRAIPDEAVTELPPELDTVWEAFQVRAAVDRLAPEERDVIRLIHFEQLSHSEIAARLGIALGTVKSRSHRAHHRLATWLRPLCVVDAPAYPGRSEPGAAHGR